MNRFLVALAALTLTGSAILATATTAEAVYRGPYYGYAPDYNYGYPPNYNYGYAPNYNYGYAPNYNYGYPPNYNYGYAPGRY
jgi:hypothetical protein